MARTGAARGARRGALAAAALTGALALAACGHEAPKPKPVLGAEQRLIGTPKERLLACAGKPAADYAQAGREYMTYGTNVTVDRGYLQSTPHIPVVGSLAMGGKGNEIRCEVRLVLKDGAVDALIFHSEPPQSTQATDAMCMPLVANCLKP